jgi:hypothetical protein
MSAATKKHLEGYKSKLAGRYEYKKGKCDLLEYSVPRNLDRVLAMKKKIIVPYMAPDNRYCVDSNGIVASVDVYFIEPNNDFCSAEALVCILNSAICNIQHKSVAKLKRDGYYEYFSNSIEKYLLPKYIPLKTDEKLRDLYSKIIKSFEELSQQYKSKADLDKLEQSILKFPNYLSSRSTDPRLQSIIDLKFAIDQIVSDLYKVKHNSVLKLCA